jgi:hypothetical protein
LLLQLLYCYTASSGENKVKHEKLPNLYFKSEDEIFCHIQLLYVIDFRAAEKAPFGTQDEKSIVMTKPYPF